VSVPFPVSVRETSRAAAGATVPGEGTPARPGTSHGGRWRDDVERASLVLVGLVSVILAVIVLARPELSAPSLLLLLGGAVGLNSVRTLIGGGHLFRGPDGAWRLPAWGRKAYRQLGVLGTGLIALGIAIAAVLYPQNAITVAIFLLAVALVAQGLARVVEGFGGNIPAWLRGSSIATGAIIVVLVIAAVAFQGFAILGFAILVGVVLLVNGIETVVEGLRPTDPRQFVLLKLILFAAFYGLVLINWIDLFGKSVPAYGIWLVMSYMAPFGVLLVFQGWEAWPLATSLGLLVSLMNDVGYYFIGNLLFGFNEPLLPWISGQLGFQGTKLVTIFEAGSFHIDVTSWMMGLSIYARAAVVAAILYYWWRHPTGLIARDSGPTVARSGASAP
jgi:uncharacterized membrane protein HdeD (DUF308 family)